MGSTLGRRNWKPGITHRLANAIPAEAWWWEHHAVGMFFVRRNRETSQGQGKDAAIYSDILDDNLLQSTLDLGLGLRFIFQQENNLMHSQHNKEVASGSLCECP